MTFREKLAKEHPECVSGDFCGGCQNCPYNYGYEKRGNGVCHYVKIQGDAICRACWDREMPMTPEEQEEHDLAINAEIIRGYCGERPHCNVCPADGTCRDMPGSWSAGVAFTSAAKQRAVLDAFEAALPSLDEGDGGRPQAAPTEDKATVERDVRERLDYLFWEASGKLKAWHETRDGEELEQAVWLLRWMTEIQEGEGWA